MTPQMVEEVDSRVEQPILTYARVLAQIKNSCANFTHAELLIFSSHFLANSFDPASDYGRMAKALLANIYYLHYMSEIPNGLQHSSRERPKDDGVVGSITKEQTPDPNDRESGGSEPSVQDQPSTSVSEQVEDSSV